MANCVTVNTVITSVEEMSLTLEMNIWWIQRLQVVMKASLSCWWGLIEGADAFGAWCCW